MDAFRWYQSATGHCIPELWHIFVENFFSPEHATSRWIAASRHWRTALDDTRVRDNCDPAHLNCNLNYKDSHCIPLVFHNLSGYDTHFIKEIATAYERQVNLLPIMKKKIYLIHKKNVKSIDDKEKIIKLAWNYNLLIHTNFSTPASTNWHHFSKDKLRILQCEFFIIYYQKISIY